MAETDGLSWAEVKPIDRHGAGAYGQSSDGAGADGHLGKYSSGVLVDNGNAFSYAADTGAANAYAVTLSPAITLGSGDVITFKAAHANTGASTLALNGGSAIAIKKAGTTALASGDIAAGQMVIVVYDATLGVFHLVAGGNLVGGLASGGGTPFEEVPAGTQDGTNAIFTASHTPLAHTVRMLRNGLLQDPNWLTISGSTFTFAVAPNTADQLYVYYSY